MAGNPQIFGIGLFAKTFSTKRKVNLDSTQKILMQISTYPGNVRLSKLAGDMEVDEKFLHARLLRMQNRVFVFSDKNDPVIMLNPAGWASVNAIKREEANQA